MPRKPDNERDEKLELIVNQSMKKAQDFGLAQGVYAACSVIRDKVTADNDMSDADRLEDIRQFCEVILNQASPEKAGD